MFMRSFLIFAMFLFLAGCGSASRYSVGVEEGQMLILRGKNLVGATLSIDERTVEVITKESLTPYRQGVLGARDRENETLQTYTAQISIGEHRVILKLNGTTVLDQTLYFSQGQTRELRI